MTEGNKWKSYRSKINLFINIYSIELDKSFIFQEHFVKTNDYSNACVRISKGEFDLGIAPFTITTASSDIVFSCQQNRSFQKLGRIVLETRGMHPISQRPAGHEKCG